MTDKATPTESDLGLRLGHNFSTPDLLEQALTHASHGRRGKRPNNERLEFLGDRVLGLVVAAWLYERFPGAAEGDLAIRHASLVSRDMLARVARDLALGPHIKLAKSETSQAERANATILADTLEAITAAIYIDGGLDAAARFIRLHWQPRLDAVRETPQDPKTALQEWAQGQGLPVPVYKIVGKSGPPHAPVFEITASVPGYEPVKATGSARQKAEKAAAVLLLKEIATQGAKAKPKPSAKNRKSA